MSDGPTDNVVADAAVEWDAESRALLEAYRQELIAVRSSAFESFDQAVLKLSAAGLGLSLAFIRNVVDLGAAVGLALLVWSWIAFGAAILSTVVSFVSSRVGVDAELDQVESALEGDLEDYERVPVASRLTHLLNWLSAVSFSAGIVLTIAFVVLNLR